MQVFADIFKKQKDKGEVYAVGRKFDDINSSLSVVFPSSSSVNIIYLFYILFFKVIYIVKYLKINLF